MTIQQFSQQLTHLSPYISGLGFLTGMVFYSRLSGFNRSISIFLGAMLFIDQASRLLAVLTGSNYMLLPYYALMELLLFIYIYHKHVLRKVSLQLFWLEGVAVAYIVAEILYYTIVPTTAAQFQSYAKPVDNFIAIMLALIYMYQETNSFTTSRFHYLWFNALILFYCTLSAFIFVPFNFIMNQTANIIFIFLMINTASIVIFYSALSFSIAGEVFRSYVLSKK